MTFIAFGLEYMERVLTQKPHLSLQSLQIFVDNQTAIKGFVSSSSEVNQWLSEPWRCLSYNAAILLLRLKVVWYSSHC